MNIVVAMKQVPDLRQIRIRQRQPVWDDVILTFGNLDKNALEAGLQIREAVQGRVIALCAGSEQLKDTVKEALAAGADEARLVLFDGDMESALSARLIAAAVQRLGQVDMVIMGEGSGDNYSSQVGPRVAQILDWPQVGYASSIEVEGSAVRLTRSLEEGEEVLEGPLPLVVTVTADINRPRLPSVTQILKAGRKPVEVWTADQLDIKPAAPLVETVSNLAPEMLRRSQTVDGIAELVRVLKSQGFAGRE